MKRTRGYQAIRRLYKNFTFARRNRLIDEKLLQESVPLSAQHLVNCEVFPDRVSMISQFPQKGVVAEVGVAQGDFSAQILEHADPDKLFLIDFWAMIANPNYGDFGYSKVRERFSAELKSGRVIIKKGYSHEKLGELENNTLDWVYIDASHDYQPVLLDLQIAYAKVKPGGIIAGHDYFRWGSRGLRFGVYEAVNCFCAKNDLPLIGLSIDPKDNWSYAISVKK